MKKLIMALAVVACATVVSAASFDWKTSTTGKVYTQGTTTVMESGTAYLFDSATTSQAAMFALLYDKGDISSVTALSTKSIADGKISAGSAFEWGNAGDTLSAYVVVVDGDNFFISDTASKAGDASATMTLSFALKNASQGAASTATSFGGAGWYIAVPEPTSGLLMLVGLTGLALRRRRA